MLLRRCDLSVVLQHCQLVPRLVYMHADWLWLSEGAPQSTLPGLPRASNTILCCVFAPQAHFDTAGG